ILFLLIIPFAWESIIVQHIKQAEKINVDEQIKSIIKRSKSRIYQERENILNEKVQNRQKHLNDVVVALADVQQKQKQITDKESQQYNYLGGLIPEYNNRIRILENRLDAAKMELEMFKKSNGKLVPVRRQSIVTASLFPLPIKGGGYDVQPSFSCRRDLVWGGIDVEIPREVTTQRTHIEATTMDDKFIDQQGIIKDALINATVQNVTTPIETILGGIKDDSKRITIASRLANAQISLPTSVIVMIVLSIIVALILIGGVTFCAKRQHKKEKHPRESLKDASASSSPTPLIFSIKSGGENEQ
ncbi:unnamed protein product, partial [Didymodactylos carnosus]